MSVNRRYSKRHSASFDVCIRYRNKRIFQARATNLCVSGMFIQTQSLSLPEGNLVDLEFFLRDRNWQVPAIVVHIGRGGFGLMFRQPQPALTDTIGDRATVGEPRRDEPQVGRRPKWPGPVQEA